MVLLLYKYQRGSPQGDKFLSNRTRQIRPAVKEMMSEANRACLTQRGLDPVTHECSQSLDDESELVALVFPVCRKPAFGLVVVS